MEDSLERVQQYLVIEQEDTSEPAAIAEPDGTWPANGDLDVTNLSAWYSLDGPEILKRVSFSVKSGERVGVGECIPRDIVLRKLT